LHHFRFDAVLQKYLILLAKLLGIRNKSTFVTALVREDVLKMLLCIRNLVDLVWLLLGAVLKRGELVFDEARHFFMHLLTAIT